MTAPIEVYPWHAEPKAKTSIQSMYVTVSIVETTIYEPATSTTLTGLYIGGISSEPTLLLWFDGDTVEDRNRVIDNLIGALIALKATAESGEERP